MGPPKKPKPTSPNLSISDIVGSPVLLPGESQEHYQQALSETIEQLEAKTPLQIYLAEKICECLWWMRRYEEQKRNTLIRSMCEILKIGDVSRRMDQQMQWMFRDLLSGDVTPSLRQMFAAKNHTMESLQQEAFDRCRERILQLEEMIALKAKTLAGFQASYEVITHRKVNAERLELQNSLMRRDLKAIDHDQPAQGSGK